MDTSFINHLDENEAKWFAVYTHYKREKRIQEALNAKGVHCFLPLLKVTRYYTRKIKKVELPLINCYLFVKIVKKEYISVLETQDVVGFLKIGKNLISIPEHEINIMKMIVGQNVEVEVRPGLINKGDEVEIIGGQLTGLRGRFLDIQNEKNFLVELENMGYSLLINIDPKLLKKVGNGSEEKIDLTPKTSNWSIKL